MIRSIALRIPPQGLSMKDESGPKIRPKGGLP